MRTESDLAQLMRYGLLLGLGLAAIVLFYVCLVATVQVIALKAGGPVASMPAVGLWAGIGFLVVGLLPILHFAFGELPSLARDYVSGQTNQAMLLVLLVAGAAALLLT